MDTSILIARILCLMYLSIGIGMLLDSSFYRYAFEKLLNDFGFLMLGGWIAIALGTVLVHYHNLWVSDWRVIITVISWIALIKGIMLLAFPKYIGVFKVMLSQKGMKVVTPLILILGLVFGYFGFWI